MKKILVKLFFSLKIFLLKNHFLGNSLQENFQSKKFFVEILFARIFSCWKIISSETVWTKYILVEKFQVKNVFLGRKCFARKFFCCKIISSEIVWMKKIVSENFFWSKIFFLQKHFLGNSLEENFHRKIFWSNFFFNGKIFG